MNSQGTGDIQDMLEAIGVNRGCVVSSADCCEIEIAAARVGGRFFVDEDSMGYVMRPREWLLQAEQYAEVLGKLRGQVEELQAENNRLKSAVAFTVRTMDLTRDPQANPLAKACDQQRAEKMLRDLLPAEQRSEGGNGG